VCELAFICLNVLSIVRLGGRAGKGVEEDAAGEGAYYAEEDEKYEDSWSEIQCVDLFLKNNPAHKEILALWSLLNALSC